MATDEPLMLLLALYVRDASGLRPQTATSIPELEPAVISQRATKKRIRSARR